MPQAKAKPTRKERRRDLAEKTCAALRRTIALPVAYATQADWDSVLDPLLDWLATGGRAICRKQTPVADTGTPDDNLNPSFVDAARTWLDKEKGSDKQ